jgi:hypothetical protein
MHGRRVVCIFGGYDGPGWAGTLHIDWTGGMFEYLSTQERVFRLWAQESAWHEGGVNCQIHVKTRIPISPLLV